MRKRLTIGVAVLLLTAVLALGWEWLQTVLPIDHCLDGGGRWNYTQGSCEHE